MEAKPKTVLLVDDDKFFRQIVTDLLLAMDLGVVSVADGRTARDWLKQHRPALVCLDLTLPDDISGYDLCDFVRNTPELSKVPILMMSARDQVADRVSAEEAGANAYLIKPTTKRAGEFERSFTQLVRKFVEQEAP